MSPENRFRPFCSERCRMVDLGSWAGESYRIPGEDREESQARRPSDAEPPEDSASAERAKKILH